MILAELGLVIHRLNQLLLNYHYVPFLEKSLLIIHDLLNTVIIIEKDTATQISLVHSFDTSLPCIQNDRGKLHQVFLNLLRNAVEASPTYVSVTIHTRFSE